MEIFVGGLLSNADRIIDNEWVEVMLRAMS